MINKEKFLASVSKEDTKTVEKNRSRIANRPWVRASQEIAMKILDKLDVLKWSQKNLAEKMGVSPQQINKIVKGKENLTLETIVRLQNLLEIPLLASYEEDIENMEEFTLEVTPTVTTPIEHTIKTAVVSRKVNSELPLSIFTPKNDKSLVNH
jgi:transcriptional regulator with XRE-family HTH domain